MALHFVIPTHGRASSQPTYDFLVAMGLRPVLAVNSEEDAGGREHVVFPHEHVGQVRQRILEEFGPRLVMLDDDIALYQWNGQRMAPLTTAEEIGYLIEHVEQALDRYAHVGLADRFMGHTRQRPMEMNKRYIKFLAFNHDLFPEAWPEFRLPVSEDLDFNLQLLRAGRENCILTEWAVADRGQYKDGGCQRYRNDELERQVCEWLAAEYPGVYSYTQDAKGRWRSRVAWRQALGDAT